MKLAGMVFIVTAAGSVGVQMARALKERCDLIRQLLGILLLLRSEITVCCTTLPKAFALAAISAKGAVEQIFSEIAREMKARRWLTPEAAMEEAICHTGFSAREQELSQVLLSLAAGLGSFDRESQTQALDMAKLRLEELLLQAEQARTLRSKTYQALCICTGLSMAILLI